MAAIGHASPAAEPGLENCAGGGGGGISQGVGGGGGSQHISRGRRVWRQLGGFSLGVVILALFVPAVCPVGGGMWGILGRPLKRAIWNTPGLHVVLTVCLRFSSVFDGVCVLLAASFCHQAATMSLYKFTPHAVGSLIAPQTPLVRKRARSGGEPWRKVTREPARQAKKPRTTGSQQPACTHKEHQILSTAEAASFASQFWDRKVHPTKASQHEFLATCIDVDLEKNVKHAQWHKYTRKRGHQTT